GGAAVRRRSVPAAVHGRAGRRVPGPGPVVDGRAGRAGDRAGGRRRRCGGPGCAEPQPVAGGRGGRRWAVAGPGRDAYPLAGFQGAAAVAGASGELTVPLPAPDPGRPGDPARIAQAARGAVLAELAALFPPLRTRLALAEGTLQQVTGDLTAPVDVDARPD